MSSSVSPGAAPSAAPAPTGNRAIALWCIILTLGAFCQQPGHIAADTKHDLTVDPWGFLARAGHMWSDIMPLGQLQNQAYGYLFPQGLFFALFSWLSPWIVQRLWWALILCIAFIGFVRLLEQIRVGSPSSRILAALLYALSPRILTTIGAISSEAWVVALAPWVMLPIVRLIDVAATRRPSWRTVIRRTLSSAVAIILLGAVNATATFAAVLPALLWWFNAGLLGGKHRRHVALRAAIPWAFFTFVGCLWWLGPLLLLGRYSPPFTDYIESAAVTTHWLNLTETLRGTTSWSSFVSTERVAGYALATEPIFIIATSLIAGIGLAGLAMVGLPRRRSLLVMLSVGLVLLASSTAPFAPFSGSIQHFLDTTGVALRNVHKFDPLVRIPLLVGFAHLAGRLTWSGILVERRPDRAPLAVGAQPPLVATLTARETFNRWLRVERYPMMALSLTIGVLALVATAPAWSGRLAPERTYTEVPEYWQQSADWLNTHADGGRTMVIPEARFARQSWGLTRDEPLQPLAEVPWVVRDAVPLVPPEAIRALDGMNTQINAGHPSPTLAATLASQGIDFLLIRKDMSFDADTADLRQVLATVHTSPGLTTVADFGKVEIMKVEAPSRYPLLADAASLPIVSAGPEAMPRLDEVDDYILRRRGVLPDSDESTDGDAFLPPRRMVRAQTPANVPGLDERFVSVATDTPVLRGRNYGTVVGGYSAPLAEGEQTRILNEVTDYPAPGGPVTIVQEKNGRVTASESLSDATTFGGADTRSSPSAAVDGNSDTYWRPRHGSPVGSWIKFTLPTTVDSADGAVITFSIVGSVSSINVETAAGSQSVQAVSPGSVSVVLPPGPTDWVRLVVLGAYGRTGINDVSITADEGSRDLTPQRFPVVATPPSAERWVFGQEIPEGQLRRAFATHRPITVEVDSSACLSGLPPVATIDDHTVQRCGEPVDLAPGFHTITTKDRWVALTPPTVTPVTGAQQNLTPVDPDPAAPTRLSGDVGTLTAVSHDRILIIPESTNPGREASVGTQKLAATQVNGWQQAWIVPAGMEGELRISFPADTTYRAVLMGGGVAALTLVVLWLGLIIRHRRLGMSRFPFADFDDFGDVADPADYFTDHVSDRFPTGVKTTLLSIMLGAVAALVAGVPGLITAAAVLTIHALVSWRAGLRRAHHLSVYSAVTAMSLAGVILSRHSWPHSHYAGDSWVLQLLCVVSVAAVFAAHVLPTHRRAGSSTSE